jgi:hypothetical protein
MMISITGSREGMTAWQRAALTKALRRPSVTAIVHGDCVGVDAEADEIAATLGLQRFAFPSNYTSTRARRDRDGCVYLAEPAAPMQRNLPIIEHGQACVGLLRPSSRGTWGAIRIAERLKKPLLVLGEQAVIHPPFRL